MNSISAISMPLLPSKYNTKNGHNSEAEINASLKTDNWAALSWNPDDDDELMLNVLRCHETY